MTYALLCLITFLKGQTYFCLLYIVLLSKNHTLEWQKRLYKRDPMQLFAEKGDFSNKKRPKRDPKSGLGLLRDPGLPKWDPVGSSGTVLTQELISVLNQVSDDLHRSCF